MPSIHFLITSLEISKPKIRNCKSFYIINPDGDLDLRTFQEFVEEHGWNGIMGRYPEEFEIKMALTEFDLFV